MATIPTEQVPDVWPIVAPLLAPAVRYAGGRFDMQALFHELRESKQLLWVVRNDRGPVVAAITTRVAAYPRRKMLAVDTCGGEHMQEWLGMVTDTLRNFAHASDLDGVELYGRHGWQRALRQYGWRSPLVLCELDAADDRQENAT